MFSETYAQYINGPAWQIKRKERLVFDNFKCSRCGDTERLQVHHATYERMGAERVEDLLTLCEPCHKREHGRDPGLPTVVSDKWLAERRMERWALEIQQERIAYEAGVDLTRWFTGSDAQPISREELEEYFREEMND